MAKPVRRVITAQKPGEGSFVSADAPAPNVVDMPGGMVTVHSLWTTSESPVRLRHDDEDPAAAPYQLEPARGGHNFLIADLHPAMGESVSAEDARKLFEAIGGASASTHGADAGELMHRTETLDYGIVLDGEITLVTNAGETHLKAGDVVVQRGSDHAWSNRSGKTCRMAFFMTSAIYPRD
jgi:hypothetical protein